MNSSVRRLALITFLLALLSLTACTMTQKPIGNPEAPYPPKDPPEVGDIYHLPTGTKVTPAQMLATVSDTRVVFVGETHDNPAAHRLELAVLKEMQERYPGRISLGMEMFNTEQQGVLDRWVAGELDEKSFLKESAWFDNWRMDFAYYRDILVYAQEQRIPVIALNAPKSLVQAVGMQPLDQLAPELQSQLPEMDLMEPYQRAMTESVFAGHGDSGKMIDGFHRVQTLWDEMMADNVVKELEEKGPQQKIVVMAGGNHVRYGFGIPRRVYRRLPVSYSLVGVHEIKVPAEKSGKLMDVDMPTFPMVAYDYVNYVAYESLPDERVKLGVRFKEAHGRLLVEAVVPGSAADKAGLQQGDLIEFVDDRPVRDSFDLVYEVGQRQSGDEAVLIIERGGKPLSLTVTFAPLPPHGKQGMHK